MPDEIHDHRDQPVPPGDHHSPPEHEPGFGEVIVDHRPTAIKHVFVLMMENRSFDHLLGFSAIEGTDARTGQPTSIAGLTGQETNRYRGQQFKIARGAPDVMPGGPGHDFPDVLAQLCGPYATYPAKGSYPPIDNSGFVDSYAPHTGVTDPSDVMKVFTPEQLPVLNALAREFVVCDRWYSSLPGPTWPNRMFAHVASSGDMDDAPTGGQELSAELFPTNRVFDDQSIFAALKKAGRKYRIYAGDHFPNVAELTDVSVVWDVIEFEELAGDLRDPGFDADYVFLEPSYDVTNDYKDGSSQHPLGSMAAGEAYLKAVYETIRASPVWEKSLLIVTYDEHGGFYDHVAPPSAPATGSIGRFHQFTFAQYGVRVPAVVVSPLIPKNLVEHRPFDHAAIPATVERVFGLEPLGVRDARGNGVNHLATLKTARTDAPLTLPAVVRPAAMAVARPAPDPAQPIAADKHGNLQALLRVAVRTHLEIADPSQREAILQRARTIVTRGQLRQYAQEVEAQVKAKRSAARAHR